MALTSNPSTDLENYPTTDEVGLFGPLLFRCHTPSWSRL